MQTTIYLSLLLVFGFAAGEAINDVLVNDISEDKMRRRRASEGDVTDFGGKIFIDNSNLPGKLQPDGTRCVKKVVFVNETVFERGLDCQHRLKKKCHLTYITDYHSAPEEKCETTFTKNCHISFKPVPHVEKVEKCHIPYTNECKGDNGPEVCKTVYETFCETKLKEYEIEQDEANCKTVEELRCVKVPVELLHLPHKPGQKPFAQKERCEKWPVQKCDVQRQRVKKIHPDIECRKMPRKICAPNNCRVVPGPKICIQESVTQIQNVPEEQCDIQPQEHCKTESTLVPRLVPKKNCVKVPKEICVRTRRNPKTVTKAVLKNWCYDPKELGKKAGEF